MSIFNKIVKKIPYFGKSKRKDGKPARLGTTIVSDSGEARTLLTPSGKGAKYSAELRSNKRYTNDGMLKTDDRGNAMTLTEAQKAYRAGYLDAGKDRTKIYNAKKNKSRKG